MTTREDSPSQIRKHYFLNQYVVVAPKRGLRPDSFTKANPGHKLETPTSRAIEKDRAIMTIPADSKDWAVKVIGNKYSALSLDNDQAYGKQEIIIETPEHNVEFSELSVDHILKIFAAYQDRIKTLSKLKGIRYVSVFKNDGPAAGASIAHAHSQVVALPLVPPHLEEEAAAYEIYFDQHQTCPYCDIVIWEIDQKVRLIFEDKNLVAVAPYASNFSFEVWLIPKRHLGNFGDLNQGELHSTAIILKNLTSKLDSIKVSYNFFLQNALIGRKHHFVLKLEPRPNVWAGLELGTGVILNPIAPEFAALWYQGKTK